MGGLNLMENAKENIIVMTYNIHAGIGTDNKLDIKRISQVIKESGAEIVALNEVDCSTTRSQGINEAESIAKHLGYSYYFAKTIDYKGGEYGNALVSKYPIISWESYALPTNGIEVKEPRGIIKAIIDVMGRKLNVLVTHLGLDIPERKAEIEYINDMIKELQGEIILMGDFNICQISESEELEPFMKLMKDCAEELNEIHKLNTFDSVKPIKKIDYILVSKDVEVMSNKIISSNASDHLPLVTQIRI
jgi:endonuclease/exonuclease/phosphatase family metal-dependent hydrolase